MLLTAVAGKDSSGKGLKKLILGRFKDQLRDTAILLAVAAGIFTIILAFNVINRFIAGRVIPDLASFVGDTLFSATMLVIAVALLIAVVSPAFLRKPLKRSGQRWKHIWSEVYGTHIKDAVWYGLIFLFGPSLLFRWAIFVKGRDLGGQAPFLLALAFLHIVGFTVGALLDWLEIRQLRTYQYRRDIYIHEWQIDKNMFFTKIKDMAILTPLVIVSWAYFLWNAAAAQGR